MSAKNLTFTSSWQFAAGFLSGLAITVFGFFVYVEKMSTEPNALFKGQIDVSSTLQLFATIAIGIFFTRKFSKSSSIFNNQLNQHREDANGFKDEIMEHCDNVSKHAENIFSALNGHCQDTEANIDPLNPAKKYSMPETVAAEIAINQASAGAALSAVIAALSKFGIIKIDGVKILETDGNKIALHCKECRLKLDKYCESIVTHKDSDVSISKLREIKKIASSCKDDFVSGVFLLRQDIRLCKISASPAQSLSE